MISTSRPAAIVAAATFSVLSMLSTPANAQRGGPPAVVGFRTIERPVAATRRLTGTARPYRTSIVGSAVDGRVVTIPVEEGDFVATRQPIVELRTGTIDIQIAAAEAELDLRLGELFEIVNGSRPAEIEQAKARLLAVRSMTRHLQSKYERTRTLAEGGSAVTRDQLIEARARAEESQRLQDVAEAAYRLAEEGPREEKYTQALARVMIAGEQLNELEDRRLKYTLRAPFEGYVVAKHTEVGEWIKANDPAIEIIELARVRVVVDVPETDIAGVPLGGNAQVRFDALPGRSFEGVVERIVPIADPQARTFPVHVIVKNLPATGPDGLTAATAATSPPAGAEHSAQPRRTPIIKAGMLAEVDLPIGGKVQAVLAPKDALVLAGSRASVFVVSDLTGDKGVGAVNEVDVRPGIATGGLVQLLGGVKRGDLVVVEGNERLRPGQKVNVVGLKSPESYGKKIPE